MLLSSDRTCAGCLVSRTRGQKSCGRDCIVCQDPTLGYRATRDAIAEGEMVMEAALYDRAEIEALERVAEWEAGERT